MIKNDSYIIEKFFRRGGTTKDLVDVNQEDLNILYRYGNQLREYNDFQVAKGIFYLLMQIDQWSFDYIFSLGMCCQKLKEYEEAIFCFGRAGIIKIDDPRCPYYAGNNYSSLGNREYAIKSYKAAIRVCDCHDDDLWNEVAEKSINALSQLNQEVHYD